MQKCFERLRVAPAIVATLGLGGCLGELPLHSDPYLATTPKDSVIATATELQNLPYNEVPRDDDPTTRNKFISFKMYLIDKAYFDYERRLTNEDATVNSWGSIGTLASTTVAAAIPAGQTTKALAAVATGLNGATAIYDDKVLLSKTIQAVQIQMRADRDAVATRIFSRRACSISSYDVGMALSDLEAYARAGTFEAALQNLTNTLSNARQTAAATKDAALQGMQVAPALAQAADATIAAATAANASGKSCPLDSPGPNSRS